MAKPSYSIKEKFPKLYLSPEDFPKGKSFVLIMDWVEEKKMGPKQEVRYVLHFKNARKGLVLTQVNAEAISALYGDQTGPWENKKITLHVVHITAFGGKDVIRVMDQIPPEKPVEAKQEVKPEETPLAGLDQDLEVDEDDYQEPDDDDELWKPNPEEA